MSKSQQTNNQTNNQTTDALEQILQQDDTTVVAQVDIDNKHVQDVVVYKKSNDEADKDDTKDSAKDSAKDKTDDSKQAQDKQVLKQATDAVNQTKAQVAQVATEVAEDINKTATQKAQELTEQAGELKDELADKAQELTDQANDKVASLVDDITQKTEDAKDKAHELQSQIKDKAGQITSEVKDKAHEIQEQVKHGSEQVLQYTKDKLADAQEQILGLKQDASDKAESLIHQAQDAALVGSTAVYDKTQSVKEKLVQKLDDTKTAVSDKIDELNDKFKPQDKLQDLEDGVNQTKDDISDGIDDAKDRLAQAKQDADQNVQAYANRSQNKGLAAKLSGLGAYLGSLYQSNITHSQAYQAVDLEADDFQEDAFHKQGSHITSQVFGAKASSVQSLASKVVPQSKLESLSDAVYDKVAQWASDWAAKDLAKDVRFAKLESLTDAERDNFAYDIANQNRALATLGGVTGIAGLVGVVADSAWLLLVSLKSVYQLAHIYERPLQGETGIKQAYGVLSGANLEKLQEKQVLLTALAIGGTVLSNAQQTSLKDEIFKVGSRYQTLNLYTKQFDELSRYVNLDRFNSAWLSKFLPLTSVAVGAHYNRGLIDEVLGTALATFCPQRPKLLTANDHAQHDDQDADADSER